MSLVFQSRSLQKLVAEAKRYARSDATVLIAGESGTGKELLARLIHDSSRRNQGPYVTLNCAALADTLIESELFGHESGAFTGAVSRRIGCFEQASGGTLFLDEVGELSRTMQPKLLRVLEENEVRRVGGNEIHTVNTRVVAATNRSLLRDVRKKSFREDLYHRLSILLLNVPPLRDRREDIPTLVQHFIERFGNEGEVQVRGVTSQVMRTLAEYDWPGNVRQLRNVIRRSCILADTELIEHVELDEVPKRTVSQVDFPPVPDQLSLREIERHVILQRLKLYDGNRTRAAEALGVTTRTLRNKLNEYREQRDAA